MMTRVLFSIPKLVPVGLLELVLVVWVDDVVVVVELLVAVDGEVTVMVITLIVLV